MTEILQYWLADANGIPRLGDSLSASAMHAGYMCLIVTGSTGRGTVGVVGETVVQEVLVGF